MGESAKYETSSSSWAAWRPFAAALEEICQARGYHLNIHGEKSNIVFSGDEADAEAIYRLVEDYLAAKDKGG